MIPLLGDYFGKGGKGIKYALKAAEMMKLNRSRKVIKVLDSIEIFVRARKADMGELQKWIRKNLDNLLRGGDEVVELVTPEGIRIRINGDFRANINLMDESGEIVLDTVRLGNKVDDGGTVIKKSYKTKFKWGNPKSTPTYGHTFSQHGQKQTVQQLIDRANGFSKPHQVGQWLDDQQAADFLADVAKQGEGVFDVKLPADIKARAVLPDGTEIVPDMVKIVLKPDGSIRTAYPYSSLYSFD